MLRASLHKLCEFVARQGSTLHPTRPPSRTGTGGQPPAPPGPGRFHPPGFGRRIPVAMYHLRAKIHARSSGKSAVACAAYRAGERLTDERFGRTQDYSRKEGVIETGIETPAKVPAWSKDRGALWNHVEAAEGRKNSRLAREFEVSLPHELSPAQRRELVRGFCQEELVKRGMIADWAIHEPNRRGDQRAFHVHILTTTRAINPEGFDEKVRAWDKRDTLMDIREAWATHANRALSRAGIAEKIDHRTLEAQGIDREPVITKGVKLTNMERSAKWQAAAREIINRITLEKSPITKERERLKREGRWNSYQVKAIALVQAAIDNPAKHQEASAYLVNIRGQIVKEIATLNEAGHRRALQEARKAEAEASKRLASWEKSNPFPETTHRLLESNESHSKRMAKDRETWRTAKAPYDNAVKTASDRVYELETSKTPEAVAWTHFGTDPRFKIFTELQGTLSEIPREAAKGRERGREAPDMGR